MKVKPVPAHIKPGAAVLRFSSESKARLTPNPSVMPLSESSPLNGDYGYNCFKK
jgi:hypothetical protein